MSSTAGAAADRERVSLGIMSGTSLDGLDVAAVVFDGQGPTVRLVRVLASATLPLDHGVRRSLAVLLGKGSDTVEGTDGVLAAINDCNTAWAVAAADAVWAWLSRVGLPLAGIDVVGCHGQTIWHRDPAAAALYPASAAAAAAMPSGMGATLQIGDGEVLLQRLWLHAEADHHQKKGAAGYRCPPSALPSLVWNFRAADVGAGGAGAPLVPYFDRRIVAPEAARVWTDDTAPLTHVVPLNLGGIANFTLIRVGGAAGGLDASPSSSRRGGGEGRSAGESSVILDARDAGPANVVADEAVRMCLGGSSAAFDARRRAAAALGLRWGAEEGVPSAGSLDDCCDWDGTWSSHGAAVVAASPMWARRASELDAALQSHPFVAAAGARRSTGREDFGAAFVARAWGDFTGTERASGEAASVVDATAVFVARALAFSAWGIAKALKRAFATPAPAKAEVGNPAVAEAAEASVVILASGGGARNPSLMAAIASSVREAGPPFKACAVRQLSDVVRFPGLETPGAFEDAKEALAFALLAHERIHREPANEPAATGAQRRVLLGQVSEALPIS